MLHAITTPPSTHIHTHNTHTHTHTPLTHAHRALLFERRGARRLDVEPRRPPLCATATVWRSFLDVSLTWPHPGARGVRRLLFLARCRRAPAVPRLGPVQLLPRRVQGRAPAPRRPPSHYLVTHRSFFTGQDRLYIAAPDEPRRRSCQTVLSRVVESVAAAAAPVLPHLAEDIYQNLPYATPHASVFEAGWPAAAPAQGEERRGRAAWAAVRSLRDEVS